MHSIVTHAHGAGKSFLMSLWSLLITVIVTVSVTVTVDVDVDVANSIAAWKCVFGCCLVRES